MKKKKLDMLLDIVLENGLCPDAVPVTSEEATEDGNLKPGYATRSKDDGGVVYVRYDTTQVEEEESDILKIEVLKAIKNINTIKTCAVFFVVLTVVQLLLSFVVYLI